MVHWLEGPGFKSWLRVLQYPPTVQCMGFGQLVILNCPSEGMCAWMIVCLSVLALGQTGNLSMMDPTFCPKIAGIGSSPPGLYKRKRMDGLWKWNENDVYWNTGVWIYNDSHQFHIIYRPKKTQKDIHKIHLKLHDVLQFHSGIQPHSVIWLL